MATFTFAVGGFLNNYFVFDFQADGTASTATAGASYVTALTSSITLPAGTWTIKATGAVNMVNDVPTTGQVRITIDGTSSAGQSRSMTDTIWRPVPDQSTKTGVLSGARTILLQYKGASGTTSGHACWLQVMAIRTA